MKQNNNTKKRRETAKTNNGLKSLILRYQGVQGWYIKEVNKYLLKYHLVQFSKPDISRIVNDGMTLTPRFILLKEACEFVVTDWGRKIGALSESEKLVSTPKGVVVVKIQQEQLAEVA